MYVIQSYDTSDIYFPPFHFPPKRYQHLAGSKIEASAAPHPSTSEKLFGKGQVWKKDNSNPDLSIKKLNSGVTPLLLRPSATKTIVTTTRDKYCTISHQIHRHHECPTQWHRQSPPRCCCSPWQTTTTTTETSHQYQPSTITTTENILFL